ncbi:hypothetical protein [Lonepinella sp. BR2357]|uniref:hypothetical protein n=1 Tax=Lonepinella sp. BR2357 TaxID=3434549 RepID=UPI003F6DEEDC
MRHKLSFIVLYNKTIIYYELGVKYFSEKDNRAFEWLEKSAENGDPNSAMIMGLYLEIAYPERDLDIIHWFNLALKNGLKGEQKKIVKEKLATLSKS